MFDDVADGTESVDDAVRFLKDELLASFKRGRETVLKPGNSARRTTHRSRKPATKK